MRILPYIKDMMKFFSVEIENQWVFEKETSILCAISKRHTTIIRKKSENITWDEPGRCEPKEMCYSLILTKAASDVRLLAAICFLGTTWNMWASSGTNGMLGGW